MIEKLNRREIERAVQEGAKLVKFEACEDCTLARQILQAFAAKIRVIKLQVDGTEIATIIAREADEP